MAKHETSWILELIDHVSGPAKKVMASVSSVAGKAKEMTGGFAKVQAHSQQMFQKLGTGFSKMRDYASEVPILGDALNLLTNPMAIIGSLAIGFGVLASNAVQANNEIVKSQLLVQATFDDTGAALDGLTAKIVATGRVFDRDTSEMVMATNALKNEYADLGLTSSGALDLIQKGLIATGNKLELNQVQEYSAQMRAAGLDAQDTIGIIAASQKMGVFDDKGIDAVKEFGLRLREMAPAAKDALKGIGLSPAELMKSLNDGSKSTFDILQQVSGALGAADVQAQQTAIADLFGGPGEDAGLRFLTQIKDMNINLDDMIDKGNPLIAQQLRRLELEEKLAAQQLAVAPFITEMSFMFEEMKLKIQMVFYDAFQWIIDNKSTLLGILTAVGVSLAGIGVGLAVMKVQAWAAMAATEGVTVAQWLWNAAMAANPIGLIITAVGLLVGALVWAWNEFAEFRGAIMGVWAVMKQFGDMLQELVVTRITSIISGLSGIASALSMMWDDPKAAWEELKTSFTELSGLNQISQIKEMASNAGTVMADEFNTAYDAEINAENTKLANEAIDSAIARDPAKLFANADNNPLATGGNGNGGTNSSKTGIEGGGGNKVVTMTIGDIVMNFTLPSGLQQGAEDAANVVAKVLTDKLRNGLVLGS